MSRDPKPTPVPRPKPTPVPRPKPTPVRREAVLAPTPVAPRRFSAPMTTPPVATRAKNAGPPAPAPTPKPVRRPPAPDVKAAPAPAPAPKPVKDAAPVVIDPRIRRRRIAVTREAGRRRLKLLVLAFGAAGLALGLVGATRSPLLDVDHVEVAGAAHTPYDEIVATAGLADTPQLLDVDVAAIARRLRGLPWVADAHATRQWPATVAITVTERREAASIPAANSLWAIADAEGRILALAPTRPDAMPSVAGAGPAGEPGAYLGPRGKAAMATAAALPLELRSKTVELTVLADGWIDLLLLGGGQVRLGDPSEQLPEKLEAAITVLRTLDPKHIGLLDVRVPRAPVLTRR